MIKIVPHLNVEQVIRHKSDCENTAKALMKFQNIPGSSRIFENISNCVENGKKKVCLTSVENTLKT